MEPFNIKFLRIFSLLAYAIVGISIHLLQTCTASPLAHTNAASKLHPGDEQQTPSTSYWIGSHTLNFKPNPFLQRKLGLPVSHDSPGDVTPDSVSSSTMLASQIETTTSVMAPTNVPQISKINTSSSERPRRKGRKVKGRRKNRNKDSSKVPVSIRDNRNASNTKDLDRSTGTERTTGATATIERIVMIPNETKTNYRRSRARFTAEEAKSGISGVVPVPRAIIEDHTMSTVTSTSGALDLEMKHQLSPTTLAITQPMVNLPIEEIIHITTPEPILPEYIDPRSNQIPVDFAAVDPEKLNPSYFRNIILKAMMDRLAGVGLVTRIPTPGV